MQALSKWAEHLNNPLVLFGFVVMLFAGIVHALLKTKILQLSKNSSKQLVKKILLYSFTLSIVVVLLGFVVAFKTRVTFIQKTEGEQSPAVISEKKDSSVHITYGGSSNEKKEERSKTDDNGKENNNIVSHSLRHIEQKTAGNQSPAVVSGSEVNITFDNK